MSSDEQRAFFLELLKTVKAAEIAREVGVSDGLVSAVKKGKYTGDEAKFLAAVAHIYGKWPCPILGEVGYQQCSEKQAEPYSAGRVKEWAVCQKCTRRKA